MRRLALLSCCLATVVACQKSGSSADTTKTAMQQAPPPPPPPLALSSLAGKWNVTSTPLGGPDTTPVQAVLTATADTAGWTMTFPNRKPLPARVQALGDSVTIEIGPYSSVIRKGVQVTTHLVDRMQDGKLVGMGTARYKTTKSDSVIQLRTEATKAP